MTTRDNRGRFISADEAAATRVLEAGVREAVRLLRAPMHMPGVRRVTFRPRFAADVEDVLHAAGYAADLLLTTNGADQ